MTHFDLTRQAYCYTPVSTCWHLTDHEGTERICAYRMAGTLWRVSMAGGDITTLVPHQCLHRPSMFWLKSICHIAEDSESFGALPH